MAAGARFRGIVAAKENRGKETKDEENDTQRAAINECNENPLREQPKRVASVVMWLPCGQNGNPEHRVRCAANRL